MVKSVQSGVAIREGAATSVAAPAAAMQPAVQLTFSLEIASLQLTPNFKMGSLQLKLISKIVSMRLAPSAQSQPAMNLQVTFELFSVQLDSAATIGTVRLTPSPAERPTLIRTRSFEISGLQLGSRSAAAPVQLTTTHQPQASVLLSASFHIAAIEFSPSFEIESIVLNSASKNVSVQLPGAGPSSVDAAPIFEIIHVQLAENGEISVMQLNPLGASPRHTAEHGPRTTAPSPPQLSVSTWIKRGSENISPFERVLRDSDATIDEFVTPRFTVQFTLPPMSSEQEFANYAIDGRLDATLDITEVLRLRDRLDHCVFLALYHSGVVRPVTADVIPQEQQTFLRLTDPLCFLDPGSTDEQMNSSLISSSFDLIGVRLVVA